MIINLQKPITKFIIFIFLLVSLFIFQKSNFDTVKESTNVFLSSILPSLFPFILFTSLLLNCDGLTFLKPILKDKYYFFFCIITGFLCGYPMGAKTISTFLIEKKLNYKQAKFLISFVNNCNPIFILSTIGMSIIGNINYGIILMFSHYISAITIALIYYSHNIIHKTAKNSNIFKINETKILHNSIYDTLNSSIKSTLSTLGNIFAYTTIFSLIYSCINQTLNYIGISRFIITIMYPIFEVTSGIKDISSNLILNNVYMLCIISFMLGFSGMSIIFQIYSCIYKNKISLSYIIFNKLLQGIISSIITCIILKILNFTSANFINNEYISQVLKLDRLSNYSYFVLCVCILYIIVFSFRSTKIIIKK